MLIILIDICCDKCINKKKEYKTLDENNVFELDVCTSAHGHIKVIFSQYLLNRTFYNWDDIEAIRLFPAKFKSLSSSPEVSPADIHIINSFNLPQRSIGIAVSVGNLL